jgi:WD40 repeat protein
MVTTGFDGTVRKWDLKNMQMDSLFEDRNATGKEVII